MAQEWSTSETKPSAGDKDETGCAMAQQELDYRATSLEVEVGTGDN